MVTTAAMKGVGHATVPRECQLGPVIVSHRLGIWGWWVGVRLYVPWLFELKSVQFAER